jgi:chromate transport protein ChrA
MIAKTEQSKYLKNIIKYLRPVIIGILLTLSIQLFISTILPFVSFNNASSYLSLQKSSKSIFFSG